MALDPQTVETIAALARLAVDDDQVANYQRELSAILALAEQLEQADVAGVEPLAHPLELTQRLRADQPHPGGEAQREQLLEGAPATEAGLFLVPKVIE